MSAGTAPALPPLREVARKVVPGLLLFVGLVAGLGALFRTPILAFAEGVVHELGRAGVFVGCLVADTLPAVGAQPILFLGYTGGVPFVELLLLASAAGVGAGGLLWGLGRGLSRVERVRSWLHRTGLGPWLRNDAARTVFWSAVLPFPFAATALAAGASGAPLLPVLLGSSGRALKALLNLTLIAAGWSAAG